MDILDNLLYASYASPLSPPLAGQRLAPDIPAAARILSDYIGAFPAPAPPVNAGLAGDPVFVYTGADRLNFCAYPDGDVLETTVMRHWYDINARTNYDSGGVQTGALLAGETRFTGFTQSSTYHLMFAYLTENTRMLQIFERLIEKYLNDEEFGITNDPRAFNWLQNSERLFFKNDTLRSSSIRSLIRPSSDATRRNAYWRMFGMDLAFGDINSPGGAALPYVKAKASNQQFIVLFEKYLSEVWQAYTNARNTSGANSSDINILTDLATDIQELLFARRGNTGTNSYANLNLSREEFASVLMTSWFMFIISDDTPVVSFLNCESSTIGERLLKIGAKVGIPAHTKSQALFEIAGAAANVLRRIEDGNIFDNQNRMNDILTSLNPAAPGTDPDVNLMTDLLTIINYWEKATGHRIKNPEANITGTVRVQQQPGNGMVKQKTLMN